MKKNKIRFGVVGTNFITDWVIAGGREDDRFELTAVCSRSIQTAQAFAQRHQITHTFASLHEMAASDCIDAVYIASPNAFHATQSIVCMQHGKHVLCEKAFASNAHEVRLMIATARQCGVVLMEAMKPTLTPAFRAVQQHLPTLGTVRQYVATYGQYSSRYDKLKQGTVLNAFTPELSNGAAMDIGIYTIYPMVVLFGRPDTIQAAGIRLSSGVDGHGSVNFQYANQMIGSVHYSKVADATLPTEIQGEEGLIRLDRINAIGDVQLIHRQGNTQSIMPQTHHNEYYYEVAEFIDLIESGQKESAVNSLQNSLITLEILDEIRHQIGIVFPADKAVPKE